MAALLPTVVEFFDDASIPTMQVGEDTLLAQVEGDHGSWRLMAAVDDDAGTLVCCSLLDVEPADDRRGEVVELLMRATAGLVIGNFEWDLDGGPIMFRTSIDVAGDRLTAALVANVVGANVMVTDHYLPAIEDVATGAARAVDALASLDG